MATLRELLGDNYREDMTLEEVNSAIENMKLADLKTGNYVSVEKANGFEKRAKEAERKLAEKLTDEEKAKALLEEREKYYASLEKQIAVNKYEKSLSFLGDANLISEVANLYAEGKIVEATEKISAFKQKSDTALEKKFKTEQMQKNPEGTAQVDSGVMTKEKLQSMSLQEKQKFYSENREQYIKLTQK